MLTCPIHNSFKKSWEGHITADLGEGAEQRNLLSHSWNSWNKQAKSPAVSELQQLSPN